MTPPTLQQRRNASPTFEKPQPSRRNPPRASYTPSTSLSTTAADSSKPSPSDATTAPTSVGLPGIDQLAQADLDFTTVPALLRYLETASTNDRSIDAITVARVAPRDFSAIDEALQARSHKTRVFYLAESKLLIITIPTQPHERLHALLYSGVEGQIQQMGLRYSWAASGASRYPANLPPASSASRGEGDSGGGPLPERDEQHAWPTIIIEAGFTQSLESLRTKIRFWFARSDHAVKIVVVAKAFPRDHAQKRILIEQWQERYVSHASSDRPGATATRLSSTSEQQPVCVQTINIVWAVPGVAYDEASRAQQREPTSFNVTRGPLRLEFARLFLRSSIGPDEHDIVLPDYDLQWCAARVWVR